MARFACVPLVLLLLLAGIPAAGVPAAGVPAPAHGEGPPYLVAFAIDTSGSLKPRDLEQTRALLVQLLRRLPTGSETAIFAFNDDSERVLDGTTDVRRVEQTIAGLQIGGRYTALYDALFDACEYLQQEEAAAKALVIVTDGKNENSDLLLDDGLNLAREDRIPVFTIGVGRVQEQELRRISRLTGGEYQPIAAARGADLASSIRELARAAPPPEPSPEPPPPANTGQGEVPVAPPPAPEPGGDEETDPPPEPLSRPRPDRRFLWYGLIGIVVLAVALAAVMSTMRRREELWCPDCGGRLPLPGAACPHCARSQEPVPPAAGPPPTPEPTARTEPPRLRPEPEPLPVRPPQASSTPPEPAPERTRLLRVTGASLTILEGRGAGNTFRLDLKSPTIIGRVDPATIQLADDSISSVHCQIDFVRAAFIVRDLESTNGTFINGEAVAEGKLLQNGDRLGVGETNLKFRVEEESPGA